MNSAQTHSELIRHFERLYLTKQYKKAANTLSQAIKKGAKTGGNYFKLGMAYYLTGDFKNAVTSYGVAVGYSPNKPDYWIYYGEALKQINRNKEAQSVIAYAQSICDDWEDILYNFSKNNFANMAIGKVQPLPHPKHYRQAS